MKQFREQPVVSYGKRMLLVGFSVSDHNVTPELIYDALKNKHAKFDADGAPIRLQYQELESDEQYAARIRQEEYAVEVWEKEFRKHQEFLNQELAAKKQAKKDKDLKYKDPEYIDFLRKQAIMRERGYIE